MFPARSPIPLMVHSIWRAPFIAPAIEFAVAKPKSLWQWQEIVTFSIPLTFSFKYLIFAPYSSGKQYPVVSGMFSTVAPEFTASWQTFAKKALSVLPASSA